MKTTQIKKVTLKRGTNFNLQINPKMVYSDKVLQGRSQRHNKLLKLFIKNLQKVLSCHEFKPPILRTPPPLNEPFLEQRGLHFMTVIFSSKDSWKSSLNKAKGLYKHIQQGQFPHNRLHLEANLSGRSNLWHSNLIAPTSMRSPNWEIHSQSCKQG